jgi:shikimate dehydrogenase
MTLRFALFGHPVQHSLSPAIHAAAYRTLGVSHSYELMDVADEAALASAIAALRRGELAGANVTIPWKRAVLSWVDRADGSALAIGAANTLRAEPGGVVTAHNTDVPALAREIRKFVAVPGSGVVIGNGGAALAAVAALRSIGASVATTARRFKPETPRAEWSHAAAFETLSSELLPWPDRSPAGAGDALGRALREADVIVQATSAGMHGADSGASVAAIVPWAELRRDAIAYDLVYNPPDTDFVVAARRAGLRASHGLEMLVVQAALAIELWLGTLPPLEPLRIAAEQALEARSRR